MNEWGFVLSEDYILQVLTCIIVHKSFIRRNEKSLPLIHYFHEAGHFVSRVSFCVIQQKKRITVEQKLLQKVKEYFI